MAQVSVALPFGVTIAAKCWSNGKDKGGNLKGSGRRVLALHGWLDSASTFNTLVPEIFKLSEQELVILAPDFIVGIFLLMMMY